MGTAVRSAGERCMAISVAVPIGEETANRLVESPRPRVRALKIGPSDRPRGRDGAAGHQAAHGQGARIHRRRVKEGADLVVDGRGFKLQG